MSSHKKPFFEKYLEPFVGLFANVNPNILSFIGSISSLFFFVFVVMNQYGFALAAFAGNAFDLVDGYVARRFNKVTPFGGFLDSVLDRVADFLVISAFSFGNIVRWEITAPFLLFSFLISYTRSRGETANREVSFAVGIIERPERLFATLLALICYMILPKFFWFGFNIAEIIFLLLAFLSFYTVYQRILYAYRKLQ